MEETTHDKKPRAQMQSTVQYKDIKGKKGVLINESRLLFLSGK